MIVTEAPFCLLPEKRLMSEKRYMISEKGYGEISKGKRIGTDV